MSLLAALILAGSPVTSSVMRVQIYPRTELSHVPALDTPQKFLISDTV